MQKSNKLEVITDGAYSLADGVSGYAYALAYEIKKGAPALDMSHGIATSSNDSESAEWEAINAALLAVEKQIKSNDIDSTSIRVHCDNEGVVNAINNDDGNSARMNMYNDFLNNKGKLNALGVSVDVVKIKGHVSMAHATPIERLHNLVDNAATAARESAQRHLFSPKKANIVSVILPNENGLMTDREQRKLARSILESGAKIRFASCGYGKVTRDNSPFYDEIYQFANGDNSIVENLSRQVDWDRDKPAITEGLDMSLLRRFRYEDKQALPIGEVPQNASNRAAGVYSLLLYGPRSKERYNDKYHTGRMSNASRLVINLSNRSSDKSTPEHLGDWAIKLGALTDVKCVPTPNDMLNYMKSGLSLDSWGKELKNPVSKRKKEELVRIEAEKLRKSENRSVEGKSPKKKNQANVLEKHTTPVPKLHVRSGQTSRQITPNIKNNMITETASVKSGGGREVGVQNEVLSGKELRSKIAERANVNNGVGVDMTSALSGDGIDKPGGIKKLHEVLYRYSTELEPQQVYRKAEEALKAMGYHINSAGKDILMNLCDKKIASRMDCIVAINKHDWTSDIGRDAGRDITRNVDALKSENKLTENFRRR